MRLACLLAALLACLDPATAFTAFSNTCSSLQHNKCLSSSTYCWQGKVYRCANNDYVCFREGPCKAIKREPKLTGEYPPYACTDNTHFAWGGLSKQCAPGTWCNRVRSGSPCTAQRPSGSCWRYGGDMRCTANGSGFCQSGVIYTCPRGYVCAGSGPCARYA